MVTQFAAMTGVGVLRLLARSGTNGALAGTIADQSGTVIPNARPLQQRLTPEQPAPSKALWTAAFSSLRSTLEPTASRYDVAIREGKWHPVAVRQLRSPTICVTNA
jgi:hypothetical protein